MSISMNTRAVGAELFRTDGQMDRHDETNSCFPNAAAAPTTCVQLPLGSTRFDVLIPGFLKIQVI